MGKLNYESHIQHFSHEHPLELTNILQQQQPPNITICSGCKVTASPDQWIYTCKSCNFNLHIPCSQMPKFINHPCDPNHPLILLPSPAYPGGLFNCDACGRQENTGFSYHCTACNIDLHILCATKPPSVNHQSHPHPLSLTFDPPYENKGFSCDICHKPGSNHWLYCCASCGFDAHIGCATANNNTNNKQFVQQPQPQPQPQPILQHHHSFPGVVHQGIPVINNNMATTPQQQHLYHVNSSPSMSIPQLFMNSQQAYNQQLQLQLQILQQHQQRANDITATAIQGIFANASQQLGVGESFLQSAMGSGNNGGGVGASNIFQSILGGGSNGSGGANDIYQSILGGGNGGTNDIVHSTLGNGAGAVGADSYTSILDSIGYSVNILDLI